MIDKEKLVEIGKFQKTHALKGELNAILDIPEEYVIKPEQIWLPYTLPPFFIVLRKA